MKTVIHCPDGHPCDWMDAEAPEPDTGCPGCPPMWYCAECGWQQSEYHNYREYKQVTREPPADHTDPHSP
jgi:hypothetical protein